MDKATIKRMNECVDALVKNIDDKDKELYHYLQSMSEKIEEHSVMIAKICEYLDIVADVVNNNGDVVNEIKAGQSSESQGIPSVTE